MFCLLLCLNIVEEIDEETLPETEKAGGLCVVRLLASAPAHSFPLTSDDGQAHTHIICTRALGRSHSGNIIWRLAKYARTTVTL